MTDEMSDEAHKQLVLASSSPRRRTLMGQAGYQFDVIEPPLEEPCEAVEHVAPSQQAEALAYFKARAVADACPGRCVLGADTIVATGDHVLGKPADEAEAREMLKGVSGTRHAVITGVALLSDQSHRLISSDVTYVTMRPMTDGEIDAYIASGEWVGKAGAYAIQETADRFVDSIEGSFTNVVGLPMELVGRMVTEFDRHCSDDGQEGPRD